MEKYIPFHSEWNSNIAFVSANISLFFTNLECLFDIYFKCYIELKCKLVLPKYDYMCHCYEGNH